MTSDTRRAQLIERIADHLLDHGLPGASLRPMAAAAGTSDRMLLYYFPDREAVLTAALERIAADMAAGLESAIGPEPRAFSALLRELRAATRVPAFARYMQLWLEVASRAARGEPPYPAVGEAIGRGFLDWAAARLQVERGEDPQARATLLLAILDGLALMDSVGLTPLADAAAEAVR
jgi:AcrR family transcriptional regulator